jgi:hypothetical protein
MLQTLCKKHRSSDTWICWNQTLYSQKCIGNSSKRRQVSSVSLVIGLVAGRASLNFWQAGEGFSLATASRPSVGPTQPPIQGVPLAMLGGKQLMHEAGEIFLLMSRLKTRGAVIPISIRLHGVLLRQLHEQIFFPPLSSGGNFNVWNICQK